ncbi:hypothetical protein HID58_004682 [Brassica napus]|uniref:S-protein homolog n=1 Tax=Brassica napus TaxID=3708 RepID=A0ABQ8E9B5_BRANA|nr:hypothetical protein HID58_004682 [Brassica napus]
MKKWQVYVVVISLFVHLVASQVETITEGRTGEITNKLFDGIRGKRTVEIINKLGGGLTLTLHCKSKDDDLGVQTLAPDSRWSFKFTPAFFGTTRFSCNFKWGGESHSFDIYDDNREVGDKQCYLCSWNIYNGSQGGFTCRFQESTGRYDICYVWNDKNYTSNRLGDGLALILYFKYKNNDLGVKTLAPDSSWSFDFRPNIFGITLFYCRFIWVEKHIQEEDLLRFMIKEEVDLVFPMFDGAAETGKIIRKAFTEWVVSIKNEFVTAILMVVTLVISPLLPEVATTKVLLFFSTQMVALTFIIGNTCKNLFESIIFV